jgi:Xaa-Pro dipeptidase
MHRAAVDALEAAKGALKPGHPLGDVFDAHARVADAAGLRHARLNACGYSLGTTFAPNWMDAPSLSMFFHGNPTLAAPGMVFFIHIILYDSDRGLAMTSGQTVLVTDTGCEPLTLAPTELVVA